MRFFLDECMNAMVDEPLRAWLKRDEFLRAGAIVARGIDDISLVEELSRLEVDAVITSDIKQMRALDRTAERDAYRRMELHWIRVPQSMVKGKSRPFVQAANLLSVIHYVRETLISARVPIAIELKRGFKEPEAPISEIFTI